MQVSKCRSEWRKLGFQDHFEAISKLDRGLRTLFESYSASLEVPE